MPDNIILKVKAGTVTFGRADTNDLQDCAFCGVVTYRVIASSLNRRDWSMLHVCNPCMGSLKKLPVSDDDKPDEKPVEIIKA